MLKYLAVLDFEATCLQDRRIDIQEIIEVPCLVVDLERGRVVDQFHKYVKPIVNSTLSPFCIKLTGITQDCVNNASIFTAVYKEFLQWIENNNYLQDDNWVFVTCGDWDLESMLPKQIKLSEIQYYPAYLKRWINVKDVFIKVTDISILNSINKSDLQQMMFTLKLSQIGRAHSGIDDVKNIVSIITCLVKRLSKQCTVQLYLRNFIKYRGNKYRI